MNSRAGRVSHLIYRTEAGVYAMDRTREALIHSAAHLHTSALSSRRRQIRGVAPLRLWFVS